MNISFLSLPSEFSRWLRLCAIACAVLALTSVANHVIASRMGIRTGSVDHRVLGTHFEPPHAYLAGSSLMGDGLAFERISQNLRQGMQTWFVAGSSPSEWEPFQSRAPESKWSIIVVSLYDLNEYFICDFRSEVVSLQRTLSDLSESRADWPFIKLVLSQYPLKYTRHIFPTVGRSQGVMVGLRNQLSHFAKGWVSVEAEAGPTAPAFTESTIEPEKTEKISEWPTARMLRRVASMRTSCQGRHAFDGLKKAAFLRMVQRALAQGRLSVIVLPVSPTYRKEFIDKKTADEFEDLLSAAQRSAPGSTWIRIDNLTQLDSNDYFWDLVHMNTFGKQIATDFFLKTVQTSESYR